MDFLLSPQGVIYNAPAIVLLALLVWKRPIVGCIVAVCAWWRVLWPLMGGGVVISFSVHAMLAVTMMFAWERRDWTWNVAFLVLGVSLYAFVSQSIGWLLPETVAVGKEIGSGIVMGLFVATSRAVLWGVYSLLEKKDPTPARGMGSHSERDKWSKVESYSIDRS